MSHAFLNRLTITSVMLWATTSCGCGTTSVQPADRAERAVEQFLDAWSRGEQPGKFANADQPLSGSDPDWENGYRLVSSLTIERKPLADQPNHVQCRVRLSLRDRSGKQLDREVLYDVLVEDRTVIRRVSP
jgi:hypothetical protein